MANLYHAATRLLGSIRHFERESFLEGFVVGHPRVLSQSDDAPDGLLPTYIISRQESLRLLGESARGITDLICLIRTYTPGSFTIPVHDTEVLKLGFFGYLKVVTESKGDTYNFPIPWRERKAVKAWLSRIK